MSSKRKALAKAIELERARRIDDAVREYVSAGSLSDAVRVLVDADRHRDAATLVMKALRITPAEASTLRGAKRQLAHRAAMYFALGGEHDEAVALFSALGDQANADKVRAAARGDGRLSSPDHLSAPPRTSQVQPARGMGAESMPVVRSSPLPPTTSNPSPPMTEPPPSPIERRRARRYEEMGELTRARDAYEELNMLADAGRVARELGELTVAAALYAKAGSDLEAAACFLETGDSIEALEHLMCVPPAHPDYRGASVRCVEIAVELDTLGVELERFLEPFLCDGPTDRRELDAFFALGRLCRQHGHEALAIDCLQAVLEIDGDYHEAATLLEEIGGGSVADGEERAAQLPSAPDLEPPAEPSAGGEVRGRRHTRSSSTGGSSRRTDRQRRMRQARTAPGLAEDPGLLQPDAVVASRYRIRRVLGTGGLATVYEAHDFEIDAVVALKVFQSEVSDEVRRRIRHELVIARELTHANIVRVHDIGSHQGRSFITMEPLAGQELRALMTRPMDIRRTIELLLQACTALQVAHAGGVIHRDIKPENLFVTEAGVLKVMDFGIARRASDTTRITPPGFLTGTPAYMAPEEIMSFGNATHQSDIYSLGVVAYEMLTAELPFSHAEPMRLMMMHIYNTVPSPRRLRPELPEELERLLMLTLTKNPRERIESCVELASGLEAVRAIVEAGGSKARQATSGSRVLISAREVDDDDGTGE